MYAVVGPVNPECGISGAKTHHDITIAVATGLHAPKHFHARLVPVRSMIIVARSTGMARSELR
jgi:hypothetical protein